MKVFENINKIPQDFSSVVSVGTFDGVHKGHQAIIKQMTDIARYKHLNSVILTFDPHPRFALKKDHDKLKLLSTTQEKLRQLEIFGIEEVVVIKFTPDFAKTHYEDFIKKYLVDALRIKYIVAGFDHHFGENRSGNHQTLIDLSTKYGYQVIEMEALTKNNRIISSTKIRDFIETHQIEQANSFLGYTYHLNGTVVEGNNTGKKLGFPTANILVADTFKQIPAIGVYAIQIVIDNEIYKGMCNIGTKPTFGKQPLTIEVNIFNFDKDIYGKNIRLHFISFIRNEKTFENIPLLKSQLAEDKINIIKKFNEIGICV